MSPSKWDEIGLPAFLISRIDDSKELLEKLLSKQKRGKHMSLEGVNEEKAQRKWSQSNLG